jgi:hypothetical protein
MDKAIALGQRLHLSGEQNELLLQSRQKLEIAAAAPVETSAHPAGDSAISRMGTGTEETREFVWPAPAQRPFMDLLTKPLDLSVPPTAADLWIPPKARPSRFGPGGMIVLPPDPGATTAPATPRTGPTR